MKRGHVTGHEAVGVGRGADASFVGILQLARQQILESVFAEEGRRLQLAFGEGAQHVRRLLVGAVNPIGVDDAGDKVQLRAGTST